MRVLQLSHLHCPFCEQSFQSLTHRQFDASKQKLLFGVLHCDCEEFPIVEGVVVLRRGLTASVAAITLAHQQKTKPSARVLLAELSELRLVPRRVLVGLVLFTQWLGDLQPGWLSRYGSQWWKFGMWLIGHTTSNGFLRAVCNYFCQRDRRPTYVLVSSLLPALRAARTVVEVGGGTGQLVRELTAADSNPGWVGQVFVLEKNFWLTYWLACCGQWSAAVCPIVVDVEANLPLATKIADVVMANDTLMYVDHQKQLATEIKRLLKPTGWFAAMHIHTAGRLNVANGSGIQPKKLLEWLKLPQAVVIDDQHLFRQLWREKTVTVKTVTTSSQFNLPAKKVSASFSCIAAFKPVRLRLEQMITYAKDELNYSEDQW